MNTLEFIGITVLITAFACLLGTMAMINTAMAIHLKMMMPRRNGRPQMENPIPPPAVRNTITVRTDFEDAAKIIRETMAGMQNDGFWRHSEHRMPHSTDAYEGINSLEQLQKNRKKAARIESLFWGSRPTFTGFTFTPAEAKRIKHFLYKTPDHKDRTYYHQTIEPRINWESC